MTRFRTACFLALTALLTPAWAHRHIRVPTGIPMRDAPTTLSADVYLPEETGQWPTVLIQTPYDKRTFITLFVLELNDDPLFQSGDYAFVVLDWRGFFGSSDAAYLGSPSRGQDGYDAVEWVAAQEWCTGKVGTWGLSALGNAQLKTAELRPPHLAACVPIVYHWSEWYDLAYPGGVYARDRNDFVYDYFGSGNGLVLEHPTYDTLWQIIEQSTDPATITVPMLHISGWYDHEPVQTIREMRRIQSAGGPGAAGSQRLLIGPWSHSAIGASEQSELDYPDAAGEPSQEALDFYDYYLRGIDNAYTSRPTVRYYRINDEWHTASDWPPPDTTTRTLYLTSDGALSSESPLQTSASLSYLSDPFDTPPVLHGAVLHSQHGTQGPGDLSLLEARDDVLTFTTDPALAPLHIQGSVHARLWVSLDPGEAIDTDIHVRLTQVLPDGRSMWLADGVRRLSLRDDLSSRSFVPHGVVVEAPVVISPLAVAIPQGYRLRALVCPGNFDRFDANLQDGSDISSQEGATTRTARVRLHLDASHPSQLILPVPFAPPPAAAATWRLY